MKTHHLRVVEHIPKKHADFIIYVDHLIAAMTNNAHLPNVAPLLATTTTQLTTLKSAHIAAQSGAHGLADARNVPLQAVILAVHDLAAHVQTVADANAAQAAAIITSAGFGVQHHVPHVKPEISAKMGPGGLVLLEAHSAGRGSVYQWRHSSDQGKTHTLLAPTRVAHAHVAGLTPGQSYVFGVCVNDGDWHETTFLVH